jgi:hypothetical protein
LPPPAPTLNLHSLHPSLATPPLHLHSLPPSMASATSPFLFHTVLYLPPPTPTLNLHSLHPSLATATSAFSPPINGKRYVSISFPYRSLFAATHANPKSAFSPPIAGHRYICILSPHPWQSLSLHSFSIPFLICHHPHQP